MDAVFVSDSIGCTQILMTGSMLYEVMDPYLVWRRLFQSLKVDLDTTQPAGDVSNRPSLGRAPQMLD